MIPPFSDVVKFHGHVCPGIIFGYRMSVRALRELSTGAADEFVVIGETGRCPADGARVVTGCNEENGRLITLDVGKTAFTYVNRKSGKAVRIWIRPEIEIADIDPKWDMLRARLADESATGEEERDYEEVNRAVTETLMSMPDEAMLVIRPAAECLPAEADSPGFVLCSACGEKVARSKSLEMADGPYCIPCWMLQDQ